MFSNSPEIKLYIFSFFNDSTDMIAISLVSKNDNQLMQKNCRNKIKLLYNYTLDDQVNPVLFYKKLKIERERLIAFLVLQQIYEQDLKKDQKNWQ